MVCLKVPIEVLDGCVICNMYVCTPVNKIQHVTKIIIITSQEETTWPFLSDLGLYELHTPRTLQQP